MISDGVEWEKSGIACATRNNMAKQFKYSELYFSKKAALEPCECLDPDGSAFAVAKGMYCTVLGMNVRTYIPQQARIWASLVDRKSVVKWKGLCRYVPHTKRNGARKGRVLDNFLDPTPYLYC